MMGLLDLPAPILSWIDACLGILSPPPLRLLLWAGLGAFVSMEIYRLLSPQRRIAAARHALARVQKRVITFDGPFEDAWPHIRNMLRLAVGRILLVLPATLLASLPLLVVIIWLDSHYGGRFPPPGGQAHVEAPQGYQARWIDDVDGSAPRARLLDDNGNQIAEVPLAAPVPVVHKRRWWNMLIGNPAGYLADELPIDRIDIALPRQQMLPFGPAWMRGWEPIFFAALFAFALLLKAVRRIH